jgi:CheY-like chemotaxis protein
VQSKDFFEIFLTQLNAEDLSAHFQRRLKESQDLANVRNGVSTATTANFTLAQEAAIGRALSNRKQRAKHEMLVVEDQGFSRLLLVGILEKNFKCHSASNASQAINLFANHAPDIVFLDVELPDVSGHELARLFKEFDRNSFIVMVTANSNVRDVELAKQNRVQGFIIKPFSKQKIQSVIESYLKTLNKTKDTL